MTLQDFKDQVAREYKGSVSARIPVSFANWAQLHKFMCKANYRVALDKLSDRAAELYAKERYDEGYLQGHAEALAGDGL